VRSSLASIRKFVDLVRARTPLTDEFGTPGASVSVRAIKSREVRTMAATIAIEIESGVFTGPVRQHPGYYAGDFGPRPVQDEQN
jgi:hypothetical protein